MCLGELDGYRQIICDGQRWNINQEGQQSWSKTEDLNLVENESIELPIYLPKGLTPEKAILQGQISCIRHRNNQITESMVNSERMQIVEAPGKMYHVLKLNQLEVGTYKLRLYEGLNKETITIEVHKGTYWSANDQFIIKKNCLLTSSAKKSGLRIESVNAKKEEAKDASQNVTVEV